MRKILSVFLALLPAIQVNAQGHTGKQLYLSRCAQCHGVDARATGPLALKSTPPTPDLTTLAFRQRLARYPGVIVSSIVLRPNGNLIPATLARNGVKLPDHIWTDQELRLIDQYLRSLIDHSRQIN